MPPQKIHLHKRSKTIDLIYPDQTYTLNAEFLRVHSPSAEVRGHGFHQPQLVYGKQFVGIVRLKPVGNYGLLIVFDDGHDSGIYTWQYLQDLGENQALYWQNYLDRLHREQRSRDPAVSVLQIP